ncbi:UvrD-helicase domain-containing protein [Halonatronum saccharophilum]|uniref:UvrD-helicase domain-containing protein n=1 Tax=Halonatronum saccharophilum TaxID=150060 RepID=UPI000484AFCC|nr:UvrD-helicase domain-containing protein [Halonatronum saccharophilum]
MGEGSVSIRGMKFTKDQALAVSNIEGNLAIRAGAGSGKTRVLTERYVEILLAPPSKGGLMGDPSALEKIVAITFTKKAAAEMKDRIRERLEELLEDESLEEGRRKWIISLLDNLTYARISTMHSFCSDILRSNLFELGLKGNFRIVEGLELERIKEEAITSTLERVLAQEDHHLLKELKLISYLYGKSGFFRILNELLDDRGELKGFINKVDLEGVDGIKAKFDNLVDKLHIKSIGDYLQGDKVIAYIKELKEFEAVQESEGVTIVKEALRIFEEMSDLDEGDYNRELIDNHYQLIECFYDFDNEKEIGIYRKMKAGNWGNGNSDKSKVNKIYKALRDSIIAVLPTVKIGYKKKVLLKGFDDSWAIELLLALIKVYQQVLRNFKEIKRKGLYFDYFDLEERVIEAFNNNYELLQSLREEISFVMVDEFQDTNQTQWDIIRPLITDDDKFSNLVEGKLFIVGDPKQSIYGFRRADVRIFNKVIDKIVDDSKEDSLINLRQNFRSNKEIIDFINYIFPRIFGADHNLYDVDYQSLTFGRDITYKDRIDGDPDSHIEVLLTEDDKQLEGEDNKRREGQIIAQKIEWLVKQSEKMIVGEERLRKVEYGDIALLMRARTNLKLYEEALEEKGIPYTTVKGKGFYQRQEVYDIYLALRSLANKGDKLSAFGLLRSPLFALSDDQLFAYMRRVEESGRNLLDLVSADYPKIKQLFAHWEELRRCSSLDKLIDRIISDCGGYASYLGGAKGSQRISNFDKLIDFAAEFSYRNGNNLYKFLKELELLMEEETDEGEGEDLSADAGRVKLMTIHASKGKEFPVVFLVDLNNRGVSPGGSLLAGEVEGEEQLGLSYFGPDFEKNKTSSYGIIKDNLTLEEEMEGKRVFYVGVTRTEDMLFLSSRISPSKKDKVKFYVVLNG